MCQSCAQVNFSTDGRYVISGDGEGRAFFWDWKTTKIFRSFKAHEGVCIGIEWHPLESSKVGAWLTCLLLCISLGVTMVCAEQHIRGLCVCVTFPLGASICANLRRLLMTCCRWRRVGGTAPSSTGTRQAQQAANAWARLQTILC